LLKERVNVEQGEHADIFTPQHIRTLTHCYDIMFMRHTYTFTKANNISHTETETDKQSMRKKFYATAQRCVYLIFNSI